MSEQTCTIIYNGEALSGAANQPLIDFLDNHGKNFPTFATIRRYLRWKPAMSVGLKWTANRYAAVR